jgi:hypothetical protein
MALPEEDGDGDGRADGRSDNLLGAEKHLEAEGSSTHVAHVEGQSAEGHREGEEVAKSRKNLVGHVLGPHARDGENAPYVQLHYDIDENGEENREGKGCFQFIGE